MSGITAKIITAVAVVAIGVGAVITYKHFTKPERPVDLPRSEMVAQEREEEDEKITEEITERPSGKTATVSGIDQTKDNLEKVH